MPQLNDLNERDQALVLMALLKEGEKAPALLSFLPEARAKDLTNTVAELLQESPKVWNEKCRLLFEALLPENKESLIKFADVGWIAEAFRGESPKILAVIIEDLPKTKVGYILKDLSKEGRKVVKAHSSSQMPYVILQLIRKKCADRFPSIPKNLLHELGPFEKVFALSVPQLLQWLHEVGLSEMSIAFSKVNRSATRAILHRLNVKDAKELRDRIKMGPEYSLDLQREAQMNILSLEMEKIKPEELVLEIGFSVFSKSFGRDYWHLAPLFIYKLPPKHGYILKRHVDLSPASVPLSKTLKVRERVFEALERVPSD